MNLNSCRAGSFLKQRISLALISLALQIANAACIPGTINDKITFDEICNIIVFVYSIFSCRVACSY